MNQNWFLVNLFKTFTMPPRPIIFFLNLPYNCHICWEVVLQIGKHARVKAVQVMVFVNSDCPCNEYLLYVLIKLFFLIRLCSALEEWRKRKMERARQRQLEKNWTAAMTQAWHSSSSKLILICYTKHPLQHFNIICLYAMFTYRKGNGRNVNDFLSFRLSCLLQYRNQKGWWSHNFQENPRGMWFLEWNHYKLSILPLY